MEPKPGAKAEIITHKGKFEGIVIQSPQLQSETLVLKLDSGYNIGIDKKEISSIKILKQPEEKFEKKEKVTAKHREKTELPHISILHTGGTISSKVDYKSGGVISKFDADEMLLLFPELMEIANISSRQILKLMSEMMRFGHYNAIAKEIEAEIKKNKDLKGIILTHGTDTLHYTSAALSFMLENLPIPIIMVGSQRSSDRGSTDAAMNLISAVYFIANTDFKGVAICMHESMSDTTCLILPSTKSRKMHTSRRDAFRPINSAPLAKVNFEEQTIEPKEFQNQQGQKLKVSYINPEIKVALVKTHTNMMAEQLLFYKGYDGIILEGTGLGHIPNQQVDELSEENSKIQKAVEALIKGGTLIVMTSQTIYGRVNLSVYTPQRELAEAGVLGHLSDMSAETAYIKLAWLLSNHTKEEASVLITKDLRGEISKKSQADDFLA